MLHAAPFDPCSAMGAIPYVLLHRTFKRCVQLAYVLRETTRIAHANPTNTNRAIENQSHAEFRHAYDAYRKAGGRLSFPELV